MSYYIEKKLFFGHLLGFLFLVSLCTAKKAIWTQYMSHVILKITVIYRSICSLLTIREQSCTLPVSVCS